MVFIDVDAVFSGSWSDSVTLETSRAVLKAMLNALSEGWLFESDGLVVSGTEEQNEAIETGVGQMSQALNE